MARGILENSNKESTKDELHRLEETRKFLLKQSYLLRQSDSELEEGEMLNAFDSEASSSIL